ncbi:MAG TPA: hypothetical protein VN577_20250 [Terriglobales bacterium]|nr:hypothetical protein [Terriglobales bacterium]
MHNEPKRGYAKFHYRLIAAVCVALGFLVYQWTKDRPAAEHQLFLLQSTIFFLWVLFLSVLFRWQRLLHWANRSQWRRFTYFFVLFELGLALPQCYFGWPTDLFDRYIYPLIFALVVTLDFSEKRTAAQIGGEGITPEWWEVRGRRGMWWDKSRCAKHLRGFCGAEERTISPAQFRSY